MAKLYQLNIKLISAEYENTYQILVPAESEVLAKDRFLTGINRDNLFTINGITWPMLYTRALITHCEVYKSANEKLGLPVLAEKSPEISTGVVKKERKKRVSKVKLVKVGIKANNRGRKSKS